MKQRTSNHYRLILLTWAGWVFDFFDLILYSFLLIPIQAEFKLSNEQTALVYSFSLAITAVGGIVLGYFGDKLGRRPAIILSIFIFSIGTLLSGFAWNLNSLIAFRIITGFGIGGEWAAGHTLLNETFGKGERGRASAFIQSGAPIGAVTASLLGAFVSPTIGWRSSFVIASIPSFLLVLIMYKILPESPKFLIFKAEASDFRDVYEKDIPTGSAYIKKVTKKGFSDIWQVRGILAGGTILSFWGMMAYWVMFSWTPKYLTELGFSDQKTGYWMILANSGAFIGYLSFGFVADFTKNIKLTFISYCVVFSGGALLFTLGSSVELFTLSYIGLFFTGLGTGFFSGFGPLYSKLFPTKIRNTCSSASFNLGRLGSFIAPLLVVAIAKVWGFAHAIALASAFGILAAIWILIIPLKITSQMDAENEEKYEEKLLTMEIQHKSRRINITK